MLNYVKHLMKFLFLTIALLVGFSMPLNSYAAVKKTMVKAKQVKTIDSSSKKKPAVSPLSKQKIVKKQVKQPAPKKSPPKISQPPPVIQKPTAIPKDPPEQESSPRDKAKALLEKIEAIKKIEPPKLIPLKPIEKPATEKLLLDQPTQDEPVRDYYREHPGSYGPPLLKYDLPSGI